MKIRNRHVIRALSWMIAFSGRRLFSAARIELMSAAPLTLPNDKGKTATHLYCAWHDCIAALLFTGPCLRMAGLTSRHADGSFVSETMRALNMKPVRGSTNHGGAAALAELIETAKHYDIAITTDGPRGPRRKMKDGIVYLASVTGLAIVPITFSCRNAWRPKGRWTDMTIPKPLARAWLLAGLPVKVPPDLSRAELAEYRELLQERMDQQQVFGDALARCEPTGASTGFESGFYRSGDPIQKRWKSLGIELPAESRSPLRLYEPEASSTESAA